MTEMLDQLKPIAEILGPASVKASYSQYQLGNSVNGYRPGWKVEVNGTYKGASIRLEAIGSTLDEAAAKASAELRQALGLP
jgi:hypothetical protein